MTVDLLLLKMTVTREAEQNHHSKEELPVSSSTMAATVTASATTSSTTTTSSRPKFMITDILRQDSSAPAAVAAAAAAAAAAVLPYPPPSGATGPAGIPPASHQHFYNFMAAAAYGFNPAAMMPGMLPLLVHQPAPFMQHHHHGHPARPSSAESPSASPRDLSFKRGSGGAGELLEEEDEDEFVDPDGSSDHEGHHAHLSDDDSDICKSTNKRSKVSNVHS